MSTLDKKNTDRAFKLITAALTELGNFAHREDVTQTAADLKLSVEHVRRHLRGVVYDVDTAKSIYDHLRQLTLDRTHTIQKVLKAA